MSLSVKKSASNLIDSESSLMKASKISKASKETEGSESISSIFQFNSIDASSHSNEFFGGDYTCSVLTPDTHIPVVDKLSFANLAARIKTMQHTLFCLIREIDNNANPLNNIENTESKVLLDFKMFFEKFKSFELKFNELDQKRDLEFKLLENLDSYQVQIFKYLKYFKINKDHFVNALSEYFPEEYHKQLYDLIQIKVDTVDLESKEFKSQFTLLSSKPYAVLLLNLVQWYIISTELRKVKQQLGDYAKLKEQLSVLKQMYSNHEIVSKKKIAIDELEKYLYTIGHYLKSSHDDLINREQFLHKKLDVNVLNIFPRIGATIMSRFAPLTEKESIKGIKHFIRLYKEVKNIYTIWKDYKLPNEWAYHLKPKILIDETVSDQSRQDLLVEMKAFIDELFQLPTVQAVRKKLNEAGLRSLESNVPNLIEDWRELLTHKRFQRHLCASYAFSNHKQTIRSMNGERLKLMIDKRKEIFDQQVQSALLEVNPMITSQEGANLEEIKQFFAKNHIHIDQALFFNLQSQKPGSSLSKVLKAKATPVESLHDWHMAVGQPDFRRQLAEQWVKHQYAIAQLTEQAIRHATLSKLNVERNLIIYRLVEHVVSIASCLLSLSLLFIAPQWGIVKIVLDVLLSEGKIPGLGIISVLYPEITLSVDSLLMSMISHCFAYHYKPHEYSFEGYKISLQQQWLNLKSFIHSFLFALKRICFETSLKFEKFVLRRSGEQLQEMQRKINFKQKLKNYKLSQKQSNNQLKERLNVLRLKDVQRHAYPNIFKKNLPLKPIPDIVEALKEAHFSYFPENTLQFFEENLGFKLTEESKPQLAKKIEQHFAWSESSFFDYYRTQRFAQIRV